MKCEKCGRETGLRPCAICGAVYCSFCGAGLCTDQGPGATLCPEHYNQVREYIEGLKPKAQYQFEHHTDGKMDGYTGFTPTGEASFIRQDMADALYEYMRAEKESRRPLPPRYSGGKHGSC